MKQKFLIGLVFCLISHLANSQIKPDIKIRVNGLGMLDPEYPTVQPGVEIKYGNVSVMYEHGFRSFTLIDKQPDSAHLKINKNKLEVRYYTNRSNNRSVSRYFAVQLFNGNYSIERWNYNYFNGSGYIDYDHAKENKKVKGIAISEGWVWTNSKKVSLDFNAGIGLRFVETGYTEVVNPRKGQLGGAYTIFSIGRPDDEGTKSVPHIFASLAFCYQIY